LITQAKSLIILQAHTAQREDPNHDGEAAVNEMGSPADPRYLGWVTPSSRRSNSPDVTRIRR
jgi:hypothetical protein